MVLLSELPRPRPLERHHKYAIAMAAVLAIATGFIVLFPRSATVVTCISIYAVFFLTRGSIDKHVLQQPLFIAASAFSLWTVTSVFWAPTTESLEVASFVAVLVMGLVLAGDRISKLERHDVLFIVESAWAVAIAATIVTVVDVLTEQKWKVAFISQLGFSIDYVFTPRFVRHQSDGSAVLDIATLTRNGFAIALLFWPMLLTARSILTPRFSVYASLAITALFVVAVFILPQEAAQVALIASAVTFALAWLWPRAMVSLAIFGWIVMSLFAAEIARIPNAIGITDATNVGFSVRARASIWDAIGHDAKRHPVRGEGAGAAKQLAIAGQLKYVVPRSQRQINQNKPRRKAGPRHPHNIFLEVRYELGLVGSLLLAIIGALTIATLRNLDHRTVAFGLATLASWSTVFATSYSLWSTSFTGAMAFVLLIAIFAIRADQTRPRFK